MLCRSLRDHKLGTMYLGFTLSSAGGMLMEVLEEAARITAWLISGWMILRLLDILFRGALFTAFQANRLRAVAGIIAAAVVPLPARFRVLMIASCRRSSKTHRLSFWS